MRPITIIGGGIAGLSLGIFLREKQIPVEIYESGDYPRHRVCGEFLSGAGAGILQKSSAWPVLVKQGSIQAQTVQFYSERNKTKPFQLDPAAICISRYVLDHALAQHFGHIGGKLHTGHRWSGSFEDEGCVRATGRRAAKGGKLRLTGIKAHASGLVLSADLEMHFKQRGYAGVCRLPGDRVNICALLTHEKAIENLGQSWPALLCQLVGRSEVQWDISSFRAVASLSLSHESVVPGNECRIGDAISMIPPLTGNGMSLAIESAFMASRPLAIYAAGSISWKEVLALISKDYRARFSGRLFAGKILQSLICNSLGRSVLSRLLISQSWVFHSLFLRTR